MGCIQLIIVSIFTIVYNSCIAHRLLQHARRHERTQHPSPQSNQPPLYMPS